LANQISGDEFEHFEELLLTCRRLNEKEFYGSPTVIQALTYPRWDLISLRKPCEYRTGFSVS
jgi:hypothetical protein